MKVSLRRSRGKPLCQELKCHHWGRACRCLDLLDVLCQGRLVDL